MYRIALALLLATPSCLLSEDQPPFDYQKLLEQKYDSEIVKLKVVAAGPTTKVLWFDWQQDWWGSMNVIETKSDGSPLYWYDFPDLPKANCVESVKMVEISGRPFIEVIDCTHMDNGFLYLYQLRKGCVHLKLSERVITNLDVRFSPRVANIQYVDVNGDGITDVVLDAGVIPREGRDPLGESESKYHREFLFDKEVFRERMQQRIGLKQLMD